MNKLLFRTVFFCLSVLSLYSCRQDDETDRSNESGDLVAVNIPIEGVRVESADSPLTRAGSADTLTVTEDLEDGFVLETSLMPVSEGLTRASITTGLASDVQILAIAYKESGELYKYQYFTPGSPIIHLTKGERFKLVFYSYNSTTKPDISRDITGSVSPVTNGAIFSKNASLNDKTESHKNNVMWGRIDRTPVITGSITLSGVTFTHLFSRLDWQLRSVVGTITECSGRVRNTYENGTIKLGNLVNVSGGANGNGTWIGAGNADYAAPVKFDDVNSTDITSSKTVFCPNVGEKITIALNKITVGGKSFTGQRHTYPTRLKRGVDYHVVSTIKRKMTIMFSSGEGGYVSPAGSQTANAFGDRLSSLAIANSGWRFEGWYKKMPTGDVQVGSGWENVLLNGSRITVIMNEKTEGLVYEARFVRSTSSVTFTSGRGGSVTPSGLQEGPLGGTVEATARPNSNWIFDGWYRLDPLGAVKLNSGTGDESVNNNRLTVTLNERTAGKTYEARFKGTIIEWASGDLYYDGAKNRFAIPVGFPSSDKPLKSHFYRRGNLLPISVMDNAPTAWSEKNDPCRTMGDGWRLPTAAEWGNGTWVSLDGSRARLTATNNNGAYTLIIPKMGHVNWKNLSQSWSWDEFPFLSPGIGVQATNYWVYMPENYDGRTPDTVALMYNSNNNLSNYLQHSYVSRPTMIAKIRCVRYKE